jgi:hypothetical protein
MPANWSPTVGASATLQLRDGDRRHRAGNPPFEAGVSQRDTDYLHIFNWKKAAEVVAGRQDRSDQRHAVIRIPTAVEEGILFLAPSRKARTAPM